MKELFKNKMVITLTAIAVSALVILTSVLVIPNVNAAIKKTQEEKEMISSAPEVVSEQAPAEVQTDAEPKEEETVVDTSSDQQQEPVVHQAEENPPVENSLVKIEDDCVYVGDIKFDYFKTDENDFLSKKAVNIYRTEDLNTVKIDKENNMVYQIHFLEEKAPENFVRAKSSSEADLIAAAEEVAMKLVPDIKRYNKIEVKYNKSERKHEVIYRRFINGYRCSEFMSVDFNDNLDFCYYVATPNDFDGIDVSDIKVDEKVILDEINATATKIQDESLHYEIKEIVLKVKNGKVIAEAEYVPCKEDGTVVGNAIGSYEHVIK